MLLRLLPGTAGSATLARMPAKLAKPRPKPASTKSPPRTTALRRRRGSAPRLVRPARPPAPLARRPKGAAARRAARPLPRLALGGHAAADDGEGRRPVFPALRRALADVQRACSGRRARRHGRLGRAWLLHPRPQPHRLRPRRCGAAGARFPENAAELARAPRHRRLHLRGDRRDRLRRAGRGRRRQRRAGRRAALRASIRRSPPRSR